MRKLLALRWRIVLSLVNGGLMLLLVFVAMRLPYAHGDEKAIVENLSVLRRVVLGLEEKPPKDRFLFIDTQYDLEVVEATDADGFPLGNQVITNRKALGRLVEVFNRFPDASRFVLFDIFLTDAAGPQDSLLVAELPRAKRLLGTSLPPVLDSSTSFISFPTAVAYFNAIEGDFYKYGLIETGGTPSYPLAFFREVTGKATTHTSLSVTAGGRRYFRTFVPDFPIRAYDVLFAPFETRYKYETLGNLLSGALTDSAIAEQARGRIVVVGNMGPTDTHGTIYGDTPGCLILLNTFLALESGQGSWGWLYLVFLVGCFTAISWQVFTPAEPTEKLEAWLRKHTRWFGKLSGIVRESLLELITYPLQLLVVSVLSFVLFGVAVTVLYLVYLLFLERQVVVWLAKRKAHTTTLDQPRS